MSALDSQANIINILKESFKEVSVSYGIYKKTAG